MVRAFTLAAGTLALVAILAMGATGQLDVRAAASGGDKIDSAGPRIVPPPSSVSSEDTGTADEGDDMTRTDFEGDEVSPALATYGIDREGNLFEVHSPHTEVPRLAGPIG